MIDIYDFQSYKEFVRKWVESQPKRGRGQFRKMADHLGVGTVLISQIFKGDRELSEEQAFELSQYLGFLDRETKYFLCLVRMARAGTTKLKNHIRNEMKVLLNEASLLKKRIDSEIKLTELQQSIFYSDWHYSAIRLATDIPELRDLESLSKKLDLPIEKIKSSVEFLIESHLCEIKGGELRMGPRIVFLPADSPFTLSRQRGWRIRAFQKMENSHPDNLFLTCPLVCSKTSAQLIKKKLLQFIDETLKEVKDSPSEELLCLNVDWFSI